ncbi:MAG: 50S ribosomal protein L33 [Planctomycetes bacterium RIFCSPHIGHO2_02_FULL_50_42]|nr:MAG: 50S ribosomal protein L33 [Planctomycetes bacterium GWA2_50_13]OHB89862.1 MAG: 50S ribosomal protein L33 [Planctomycetes bacterium RIFCSPHIGHO2_02_FULL_50_42]OHB91429.1 MAG: 50S ribosomal protein L33 [Planctomycetes bacterium RIFCSPHIGHO2_12_FULL_51_37]OHB95543.1 MAG: 50S ribosomal protein L33 [Planctomycetes bacterium RIFCSPLOWO2_02_FULL_50_16]OHC05192.1 MAG: 50S ribosomal protein L33 [Planctomycetes bacterium RIFCSPLOWO2_12_FULL_50_35]HCN20131.1 50S ribosomal protein L33 [Planctomyce
MRESITLVCSECSGRNYRTSKKARAPDRLEIKKYCRFCRKHTEHKEQKK